MLPFWVAFNVFVVVMLALDLGVFHRKSHVVKFKEALVWSAVWISLAGAFAVLVYYWRGQEAGLQFVTGYLIELSLSVDNLFVFLILFSYFKVPDVHQHKVLFWGIVGALLMRVIFILGGVALINRFHWIIYVFGAFLVYTGIKLAVQDETDIHPETNPVLKWFRRTFPMTKDYEGGNFFVVKDGKRFATPLFAVLLVVETTDLLFAVDSIPAILAITRDPFIVYTSNVFAILGLRSMYFALAGLMAIFHYLNYGLAAILVFIGAKMLASSYYKIPIVVALGVVASFLALSIVASILFPPKDPKHLPAPPPGEAL
ncbi:MAG TPA: TerC family protein [Terriglobales bacterium]|nr:TerC family protein [Terriglobales bacterium]